MTVSQPRVRRTPAPWWLGVLVAVSVVLGGLGAQHNHAGIEQDLTRRSVSALQAVGITDAAVAFSGRDGTVTLGSQGSPSAVHAALDRLPGVRQIVVSGEQP